GSSGSSGDPSWTAQEEMALLEAVMDCGFGNWQDVANQMCTKTKEECEKHYMKYFSGPSSG
uniref:Transcriptional adaptor 2-like, isoform b n=1 Tax=Homo sapiens TaxID=9606 RepID=UPI00005E611D|nr:Chain A, Transcriptional adaptor 2-like, isoform b [Homo sapiens]